MAGNRLLEPVTYERQSTAWGEWRRYYSEQGGYFAEFTSHARLLGLPWLHYTRGICPETGRRIVAKGVIAVGRIAVGGLAAGQLSAGLLAIGQAGLGLIGGLGQAATGLYALGQLAIGPAFAVGQLGVGEVVIAQLGVGQYVLAQAGFGEFLWTQEHTDPEARRFFTDLYQRLL